MNSIKFRVKSLWKFYRFDFTRTKCVTLSWIQGSAKNLPQSCTSRLKPGLVREVPFTKYIFPLFDASS